MLKEKLHKIILFAFIKKIRVSQYDIQIRRMKFNLLQSDQFSVMNLIIFNMNTPNI